MSARARSLLVAAALATVVLAGAVAAAPPGQPPLPQDYRSWTHVRSMVVTDPDHGMYGFQDVYANKAALATLRSGKAGAAFPDGAVLVAAIYEVSRQGDMIKPGAKWRTAVKAKDRAATATGGWRFAVYDAGGKPVAIDPASCYGCHSQAKATDFVFSRFSE